MFEEDYHPSLLNLVLNEKQINNTMVVIVLDLQEVYQY